MGKWLLRALVILCVVAVVGFVALKIIVMRQVTDGGVMEDPNAAQMLDGDGTYVDNPALLAVIAGTWTAEDWTMTVGEDADVTVALRGETVLSDRLDFVYLLPGAPDHTDFTLIDNTLQTGDGTVLGEVTELYHAAAAEQIALEATLADGQTVHLDFTKTA